MKHLLILCSVAIFALSAPAQSLDECRRLAREHYPEIRQYDLIAQTEEYNLSNAAKAWIPQLALSGQATYQTAVATYPEALSKMLAAQGMNYPGMNKDQYKVLIDITQHIWDGGQSKANRAIHKAEAAEQRRQLDVNLYDLQARIDNLYFGILLLDERIAQTKSTMELLESNLNKVRSYHKNGTAMQADVNMVEVELLSAGQTLEQAEASRASYRRMLELFIGQLLSDDVLQRPALQQLASYTPARPELALFDARIGKLNAQRQAVNSSIMPRFSAFAQGYYGYPGLDMFKSMTSADWTLNAIAGIRMSWNIGAFYTKSNSLKKLHTAEQQIAVQRDIFLFNTELQTTQDDGEIARLRKAVSDDKRIVELRRSVRMAEESRLENGVIDTSDLLRKITEETVAAQNRSTHEIELLQAVYRLKHTLNQ